MARDIRDLRDDYQGKSCGAIFRSNEICYFIYGPNPDVVDIEMIDFRTQPDYKLLFRIWNINPKGIQAVEKAVDVLNHGGKINLADVLC